jgi:hypothetical protein
MKIAILILSFLTTSNLFAQSKFGVNFGGQYNTLIWKIDNPILDKIVTYKFNIPNLYPFLYLNYNIPTKFKYILKPFLGISTFGGNSKSDTTKFKDKYQFITTEIGTLLNYKINNTISLGLGIKSNYKLYSNYCSYGNIYQYDSLPRIWTSQNINDRFKKINILLGSQIIYKLKWFALSGELWYGMNNLNNYNQSIVRIKTYDFNYRVGLIYELKKKKN